MRNKKYLNVGISNLSLNTKVNSQSCSRIVSSSCSVNKQTVWNKSLVQIKLIVMEFTEKWHLEIVYFKGRRKSEDATEKDLASEYR